LALVCCSSGDIGAHSGEIKRLRSVAVNMGSFDGPKRGRLRGWPVS